MPKAPNLEVMPSLTVTLNDGRSMPRIGLGTAGIWNDDAPHLVARAIAAGYSLVDTASCYVNEVGIGAAIRSAATNGRAVFITTKLWNTDHGYDSTLSAFEASRNRLRVDVIDLYLIHWPVPDRDLYIDSWRAMIRLRAEGRIKSIGVSNFTISQLHRLIDATGVIPAVNQIELHPRFQQRDQRAFHAEMGIVTEAWSPLGFGKALDLTVLKEIARKHGKSPAQVVIRWHVQAGNVVIPKASSPSRLRENLDALDFQLDTEDMGAIEALDDPAGRLGPCPDQLGIEGTPARWLRRFKSLTHDPSSIAKRLKRMMAR
jgi:2,5-diketo-D-gluconate reductase A